MGEKTLFVGYNLSNDITQISVYRPENAAIAIVGATPDNPDGIWETSIGLHDGKNSIRNFVADLQAGRQVYAAGKPVGGVKALTHYFKKTLSLTKRFYPQEMIRQLVITTEEPSKEFTKLIYEALENLGIGRERARVISHKQSFLYYVMSQEKSLWTNDVGMFEYHNGRLIYQQMNMNRRSRPILVGVSRKDYTERMTLALDGVADEGDVFESIARSAVHKQILSALYMTGNGFECEWAQEILQKLCVGRRVFLGNNLYVAGAGYAAREFGVESRLNDYIFLDEDMIQASITIKVYADAKEQELYLAKAGTPWYQVEREFGIIPDDDNELAIHIRYILQRDVETQIVPLEELRGRTDRMVRLSLNIRFADASTCILTIKDKGFGNLMPSSNRIWEKIIVLREKGSSL